MGVAGDQEGVRLRLRRTLGQGHRLGGGGGFVQQRGVGDLHAGQVGAHLLEVDQRFHAALRDLRLVRRVRGVPGRVFQDVAEDDVRRVGAVIALADEAAEHLVLRRDGADLRQRLDFGEAAGQGQRRGRLDRRRHDRIGQRLQRVVADHPQHRRDLGVVGADVAFDERVVVLERAKGRLGHGEGLGKMAERVDVNPCPCACRRMGARRLAACAARKPCSPRSVLSPESLNRRGPGREAAQVLPLRRRPRIA
jgi:hypothetical protein